MCEIIALVPRARQCPDAASQAEGRDAAPLRLAVKLGFEELTAEIAFLQIQLIKLQMMLACVPESSEKADVLQPFPIELNQVRLELRSETAVDSCLAHVLIGEPVPTSPEHALVPPI